jgi:hypothetical protein
LLLQWLIVARKGGLLPAWKRAWCLALSPDATSARIEEVKRHRGSFDRLAWKASCIEPQGGGAVIRSLMEDPLLPVEVIEAAIATLRRFVPDMDLDDEVLQEQAARIAREVGDRERRVLLELLKDGRRSTESLKNATGERLDRDLAALKDRGLIELAPRVSRGVHQLTLLGRAVALILKSAAGKNLQP